MAAKQAFSLAVWAAAAQTCLGQGQYLLNPKNAAAGLSGRATTLPIDISSIFNNRGFAMTPGDADFDGGQNGYPAEALPPPSFMYNGIDFSFPTYNASGGSDNALAIGQTVSVPKGRYQSVYLLAACESGLATGYLNGTYADGSTSSGQVLVPAWWDWPYPFGGDIVFPYFLANESANWNRSMIYLTQNWLDSTRELTSITLPNVTAGSDSGPGGAAESTRLHIFAMSLLGVPDEVGCSNSSGNFVTPGPLLQVQFAMSTPSWIEGTNKTQIVDVLINNVGTEWVLANHSVTVSVKAEGLDTVVPATIKRLRPGDQAHVQIGVVNKAGVAVGTTGTATILINGKELSAALATTPYQFNATYGIAPYEATFESVYSHPPAPWFQGAKFGIFIHWGVYSVPGWGNVGANETYAEWYWWNMNVGPNTTDRTYEYDLATYGPNHVYDDFIQNFTAANFNPKDWVDLFADAGAQYFVQVSKHHDGYAIFDLPPTVTNRTSVALFPHRNLLQELFDAAATYQPTLHRATYYSLPEWFSPAYAQYGFGRWPGGNATNPFTNETLPYTGFVPVEDYVTDVIVPQMQTLADMGTEIMWCDIGGPNMTTEWASAWFNSAAEQGRQVVLNARCGLPGDFDTPEYARYGAVQARKWESNLGMDPFSYGYNRATPAASYMNASTLVSSLVDIISKNGNFLLDVGPQSDGTIVQVEQDNLREAGVWIHSHAEAIFNTTYWFISPEDGDFIRFTQTPDAFYIHVLAQPNGTVEVTQPVPFVQGDAVQVVGGNMSGTVVPSTVYPNGSLILTVSDAVSAADQWVWVFKISFDGQSTNTTTPTTTSTSLPGTIVTGAATATASGSGSASASGSASTSASAASSSSSVVTTSGAMGRTSSLKNMASSTLPLFVICLVGLMAL